MTGPVAAAHAEHGSLAAALLAEPVAPLEELSLQLSHAVTLGAELHATRNFLARHPRAVR
jgi:hypothetical protein